MIIGFGQTLCLLNNGIDLSIASNGALTSMFVSYLPTTHNIPAVFALLAGFVIVFLLRKIMDFITHLNLNTFIVMMASDNIFCCII